ncbi:MAG: beta-lactamase family protein [Methylacidiphilales bacterium]|nr:beta-lactamase family protein [Candidatus Methylacidiphilales bacterium]
MESLLNEAIATGKERGAQVAIYRDGKLLADAWAGVADVRSGQAVDGDTLFPVFSATKGMMATVMHILAERGQVDYDKPVAYYWPEFAAKGKEKITVRHALAHTSGLPYMPEGVTYEQLGDWDGMCRLMAQMEPVHPAGERQLYHAVTYGWILGEVARRVDGRAFQPFMEAEICGPLGLTTMFCGLPAELEPRVAFLEITWEEKVSPPPPNDIAPCMIPLHEWMNRSDARRACLPASSGIMNARALARHYAALLPGGVDGVELISPKQMAQALEEQVPSRGYEKGFTRRGVGYILNRGLSGTDEKADAFGHPGYGGSFGYADTRHHVAVGLTHNRFSDYPLGDLVEKEIRTVLGLPEGVS